MTNAATHILDQAHSYATFSNAEKKAKQIIGRSGFDHVRYVILAQADGRFTPAACLDRDQARAAVWFANNNMAVIG